MKDRTIRHALHAMSITVLLFASLAYSEVITPPLPATGEAFNPAASDTLKTIPDSSEATGFSRNHPVGTEPQGVLPPSSGVSADTAEHTACNDTADEKNKQDMDEIKKMLVAIKDSIERLHDELLRGVNSAEAGKETTAGPITSEPSFYSYGRIALGFEEMGLAFQFRFTSHAAPEKKQLMVTSGIGYDVRIPTEEYRNTLSEWHVKAGVFRDVAVSERLRLGVYLEAMEKMKQFETDPLLGELKFNVYSVWATKARLGTILSIFCLRHFMLTYRIGIEGAYSTSPFYVNLNKTKLIKLGNGNFKVGLCGSETSMFEALFNNIGIYYSF